MEGASLLPIFRYSPAKYERPYERLVPSSQRMRVALVWSRAKHGVKCCRKPPPAPKLTCSRPEGRSYVYLPVNRYLHQIISGAISGSG